MKRIFDLVGWLGTAIVAVVVVLAVVPGLNRYSQYSRPLALAGLVCVLLYVAGFWREFAKLFSRRQARYGTLSAMSTLVVLGILIAVNYIGAKQHKRWDLTANQQFSLSDQTRNVLTKLDGPLKMHAFPSPQDASRYQDRLKEYEAISKSISTEVIDPDTKPAVARQYQADKYGLIVLEYKDRKERVSSDSEQDITNGIIKIVSGQQRKVYFTQGHGERDTTSSERDGYNTIAAALGRENYTVDKVVIAQRGSVPDDAAVVIVAGPHTDFFATEIDALKKYLDKAGKLLIEIDPPDKADAPPFTNLLALAHDWGVEVGNDVVIDLNSRVGDAAIPVAANYPGHPITERFRLMSAFPFARSSSPVTGGVNVHTAVTVVETGQNSWAETDIKGLLSGKEPELDESKGDKKGPVSIAAAVSAPMASAAPKPGDEGPRPETRVVVFGDSDFASNAFLGIQGNRDLFMNVVGWLSQQENLISIRPKEPDDRRITLTSTAHWWLNVAALVILPGCIFGTGIYSWWRRR